MIKVQVADRNDVATLANIGLDIWEYREGGLIIRVTDDERNQVKESGFTIETITEDVYEYTEKIRKDAMSLNPSLKIFEVSCKTGKGIAEWAEWLTEKIKS